MSQVADLGHRDKNRGPAPAEKEALGDLGLTTGPLGPLLTRPAPGAEDDIAVLATRICHIP
ncbi:hypothetical protein [Streptomyces roseolus]|uniref:hypothetical protein n=1 Tax=Streptomyces roseolus TaxID=67358 RepID=UPI00364A6164